MYDAASGSVVSGNRIFRMGELKRFVSISESHLYDLISRGLFPKPISLIPGGRAKGWRQADVEAWIESRRTNS